MRVLVTGVCGFVGSTITRALVAQGVADEVLGLDNLSRGGSEKNVRPLGDLGIQIIRGDIRCASDMENLPGVDWVIDAAADPRISGGLGRTSSRQLMEHNLLATVNLLEYCKRHQAGIMILSTSRVYSIPPLTGLQLDILEGAFHPGLNQLPGLTPRGITEAFSTNAPVSLYGSTKLASEHIALEYGHAFEFPVWINRCGVMAGAGQFGRADQGIFSYWLHAWREGHPLRYIGFGGEGFQVRDCLHPFDLVPLFQRQTKVGMDRAKPQVVNVSGGATSARSLRQLSSWCEDRWGPRNVDSDLTPRTFDLPWVVLDHTLATDSWNWHPARSTDEILEEIAEFAEKHPDWLCKAG